MGYQKPTAKLGRMAWLAMASPFLLLLPPACSTPTSVPEDVGQARSATFVNGGFETGTAGQVPPAPWVLTDYLNPNPNGITIQTPQTLAGLNLTASGMACATNANCDASEYGTCQGGLCKPTSKTIILNGANQPDATLGATASLRWPRYGKQCALINQLGDLSNVNALTQTMTVAAADVDPADGQIHIRFVAAPVLEDPAAHTANQQPYFYIQLTNLTRANAVLYSNFNYSNQPGVTWQTITVGGTPYTYTDWQLIDIAPGTPAINIGDSVQLDLIAAGCSIGGHVGQLYVDGLGPTIPGLTVEGTGPAQANAGTNITYDFTYTNGSPAVACSATVPCASGGAAACVAGVCGETGGEIVFTVPVGTTFQSITPPAGATCTALAVGSAAGSTITCTFSSTIPAGGSGTFTVTVQVVAGTTAPVACGAYSIQSTQEPEPLIGPKNHHQHRLHAG